jgi:UPF0716 protein FxsA
MFARLLLLFIIVPLVDLLLLLGLTKLTHWSTTIMIVIVSGIIGAWLAQRQTQSVSTRIREQLVQNNIPSGLMTDGAMILFAAGLLITPGLITDLFGLSLLIPYFRGFYKQRALKWLKAHLNLQVSKMQMPPQDPNVVDGEVVSSGTPSSTPRGTPESITSESTTPE